MSSGAKAGVGVGTVAGVFSLGAACLLLWRHLGSKKQVALPLDASHPFNGIGDAYADPKEQVPVSEAPAGYKDPNYDSRTYGQHEVAGSIPQTPRYEVAG